MSFARRESLQEMWSIIITNKENSTTETGPAEVWAELEYWKLRPIDSKHCVVEVMKPHRIYLAVQRDGIVIAEIPLMQPPFV